jgi:hypothetical protein
MTTTEEFNPGVTGSDSCLKADAGSYKRRDREGQIKRQGDLSGGKCGSQWGEWGRKFVEIFMSRTISADLSWKGLDSSFGNWVIGVGAIQG